MISLSTITLLKAAIKGSVLNTELAVAHIMAHKPDEDELLVHGYCRVIQSLLNAFNNSIPAEIIVLCLKFYPNIEILQWSDINKGSMLFLSDDNKCAGGSPFGCNYHYVTPHCNGISSGIGVFRVKVKYI